MCEKKIKKHVFFCKDSPVAFDEVIQELDTDGDGRLTFDDFRRGILQAKKRKETIGSQNSQTQKKPEMLRKASSVIADYIRQQSQNSPSAPDSQTLKNLPGFEFKTFKPQTSDPTIYE